ncbi:MAG: serine/threonine protein kinase [Elusimicrobia bacterium]|nr:serine/threonine protein kinase [Elusimicrobiota bacterium]
MRAFAVLASAWLCAAAARADMLSEHRDPERGANETPVDELRNMLDKDDGVPASTIPAEKLPEAIREQMRRVKGVSQRSLDPLERLEVIRGSYPALDDLAAVDADRSRARRALLDLYSELTGELQRFNSLKKAQQNYYLGELLGNRMGAKASARISDAVEVAYFSEEVRNLRVKIRSVLESDDRLYGVRARELEAMRRWRKIALISGGAFLLLALATLRIFRKRWRLVPSGAVEPGSVLAGNYRIERELGRGGMGIVFEATDLGLHRKVALKQLRPELKQNPRDLEMFLAEARLVAALRHPHIVEIHAIVNQEAELLLVFELVPGQPLHQRLQAGGPMGLDEAFALIQQIASALDFAHANKIIHRDLKPANVMVTPQGKAKVMDFGLAHQASVTVARLTRTESWGTPPYMAPEQELGEVSRESDIFSLAVMLYEALTGRLPFPGPNYLAQKRELRFAPVSRAAPSLPAALDAVFERAFQPVPARRYHSARELAEALGPCADAARRQGA